jgi:hypothetical protein
MNHCESAASVVPKAEASEMAMAAALLSGRWMTERADPDDGDPLICKNCIHLGNADLANHSQSFAVLRFGMATGGPFVILPAADVAEALWIVRSIVNRLVFNRAEHRRATQKTLNVRGPPEMAFGSKPPRLAVRPLA